ncbi:hypothetical protein NFI96_029037, partial [Prochilodus magdalenae]
GLERNSFEFFWLSYSTPIPQSARQLLTLLLMCLAVSMSTGALLFHWLRELLMYDPLTAGISSGIYAAAVLILSFLVHPFRCAFTLMFPTLGTKQGRKLVLSACAMIVVLYILPNIATNTATITHLMKCISENLAHSLLNSSELSNRIKSDMVGKIQAIQNSEITFVEKLSKFNHSTDINVSELSANLNSLGKHVEEDLSKAKHYLEELKLLSNRIFAAVFVFFLFGDATIYLKSYLTSVKFDNVYITGLLRRTANKKGVHVEAKDVKNGVNSTSFRMTKREMIRCLVPILQITLYLVMTVMLIIFDHIVCYLLVTGQSWLLDIPSTDVSIEVNFKVGYSFLSIYAGDSTMNKLYSAIISSDAAQCKASPSNLNPGVLVSLGLLYLLSYFLVLLEVYARRLRRKVASSFFQKQEKKRIDFLIEKIKNRRRSQQDSFLQKQEVNV